MLKICEHTFYAYLSRIWKLTRLSVLSGKFLRQKFCYPESFPFLRLCAFTTLCQKRTSLPWAMQQRRESWNLRKTFSVQLFRVSAQLLANFSVNLPAPHLRLNGSIFPSGPTWLPRKLSLLRKKWANFAKCFFTLSREGNCEGQKWANFAKCLYLMFLFAFLSTQEVNCEDSKITEYRL